MNDQSTLSQHLRERTEHLDFAAVDVDAIVAAGDRRRRRRTGLIVGGVASLALVGAVSAVVTDGDGPSAVGVAGQEPAVAPSAQPSWSRGDTLVTPDGEIRLERPIHAFVATDVGYVVLDDGGTVWSVRDGRSESVGTATLDPGTRLLVTDGEWTAWSTRTGGELTYHVLDQRSGLIEDLPGESDSRFDPSESSSMASLDDGVLYTNDGRGIVATDVRDGTTEVLMADMDESFDLIDARAGLFAVYDEGLRVGPRPTDTREVPGDFGSNGLISPDGRFYAPDEDVLVVLTVAGTDVTPRLPADYAEFATTVSWRDDDTIGVIATARNGSLSLLSCEVPSGACSVDVADLGVEGEFQVPLGQHIGD